MVLLDLIAWDYQLFKYINYIWAAPWLDSFMLLMRNKYFWIPLYILITSFFVVNFKKESLFFIIFLIVTASCADLLSSKVMKPQVKRLRPCNTVELNFQPRMLIRCSGSYSFTSSHATNHFSVAIFLMVSLGGLLKRFKWLFLAWAGIISIAQVYVGAHFPLDVISGALLGSIIGSIISNIYLRLFKPSWDSHQ